MEKIFYNALSYDSDNGGWFICEARDWPYKNKTVKPIVVAKNGVGTINDDPEVQAFLNERKEVDEQLHQEMAALARSLNLVIRDFNGVPYPPDAKIEVLVLDDADGKKLTETLLSQGWIKQFIPIGP